MKSQGQLRSYLAKKYSTDEFTRYVATCIGREFNINVDYCITDEKYIFKINKIVVNISKEHATQLQKKNPYAIDKYILDELYLQGFEFIKEKSQYLRSIYGISLNYSNK